jgi:imidazolonepropionase
MMKTDKIIFNCGQILTMSSGGVPLRGPSMRNIEIIRHGAIAIEKGRILDVGSSDDILSRYQTEEAIDAGGRVVSPGFVDPHTHIVYAGDRLDEFEMRISGADYLEILGAGGGIISTVRKTRNASEEQLLMASSKRLAKMLECGTTTIEIKTGYGLDLASELKMLEVIAHLDKVYPPDIIPTFLAAHAVPPEYRDNREKYLDIICLEMLPAARDWYQKSHFSSSGVPFFVDVFCEKNAFSLEESQKILETARQIGFLLKAHTDEFNNLGASAMAIESGAVSIDHLDEISECEIKKLAESDTVAVITPTVNFNSGTTKFADARKLMDAGCIVALSTDFNPGSAPCPSQPLTMAIACRYQRLLPGEAFAAATINAAFAVKSSDRVGSLEAGKQADLLIFNCDDYRQVAYEFGGNLIKTVFKRGNVVLDN